MALQGNRRKLSQMNCPNCWPPYPLKKSGWDDPEYRCRRCGGWFDDRRKSRDPPDYNHEPTWSMGYLVEFAVREGFHETKRTDKDRSWECEE